MDVTLVRANPPLILPMNGANPTTAGNTTGNPIPKNSLNATVQLIATAAATVVIEVTNDPLTAIGTNSNWITLATVSTAGAGTDGFATNAAWNWIRARTTANAGVARIYMGC